MKPSPSPTTSPSTTATVYPPLKALTVTITGTNDQPVITAEIPDFQVIEAAGDGLTTVNQSGSLGFDDLDSNDTLSVAESFTGATWSGGQLTAEQSNALDPFSINPGNGDWNFNGDLDLNFLAVGETITLTYDITVDDGNGLPATQSPLTVTITGTNDQPVITAQIPDFHVIEAAGNGLTTVNQTGSLGFDRSRYQRHSHRRGILHRRHLVRWPTHS